MEIPAVINTPVFLKFLGIYAKKFIAQRGFGYWLKEYQRMEEKKFFSPNVLKVLYTKMLLDKKPLTFIERQAIYYIGVMAQDAAQAYINNEESSLYKVCVFTGETAEDEDGDEYIKLSKKEAEEICKALNEEAEEDLFVVKRM